MPKDQIWPIIQEQDGTKFDMVFSKVCNLLESSPALFYTEEVQGKLFVKKIINKEIIYFTENTEEIKMLKEIEEMTNLPGSN